MCGIAGFNWDDKKLVMKMAAVQKHRGPDDSGFYNDKNVSLGHSRLSIIDLSEKGKQPMSNEDGSLLVVYNGEIYNFQEIRNDLEKKGHKFSSKTDTEVIVHAYEEYGASCLDYFNGMFAFCIYDMNKKQLFLARDRIGIKPLYYYFNKGKFIFASEIKAIVECSDVERKVNIDAFNNFISLRYNPIKETIFEGVERLFAGHYMVFDLQKKTIEVDKYWDITINPIHKSKSFFVSHIRSLLSDSVEKRLISDVPLGVYLSGGLDSSAIVAMMSKLSKGSGDSIKTFSVGFRHGEHVDELPYAKAVSDRFSTDHKDFLIEPDVIKTLPQIIWHLDEPCADPALIPVFFLSEYAKKSVTVILTGDGGDELFAGYDQYKFLVTANKLRHIPSVVSAKIAPALIRATPNPILNMLYKHSASMGKEGIKRFTKFISKIKNDKAGAYYELISIFDDDERKQLVNEKSLKEINYNEIGKQYFSDKQNFTNQLLRFDTKRLLPESYLMKTDRMTMAHSVEARVPFLDHRMAELAFSIPPSYKLNGMTTKYILKQALHSHLPKDIITRKKQSFHVPVEEWIEKDLKHVFEEMLSEKAIKSQGYFDYGYIEKIFRNYSHSKLFYARQLWNIMSFQLWHKIYIERENVKGLI
ncbi:asparagine synthase (glutamine-hydrolyzing) [Candidatus Woesearchaeota archaeon]|nr:asparagine synthase (glutamine-hydrolyzing) [Candidatus Woesearchaeota archaeon]